MRLRHLDFLRGIAVLLVLLRHYALADILYEIGWIGVDLFFVLSGFLVSSLLFNEYKKYNNIKPGLFLIRRGFKIYPLFYTAIIITIIFSSLYNHLGWTNDRIFRGALVSEIFFLQNYFGHLWDHTWSLAVEEHFYFSLAILIFLLTRKKILNNKGLFTFIFLSVSVVCLGLRIYVFLNYPYDNNIHLYPTHLRIDSLMFGVFLSYNYTYQREGFISFFQKWKKILLPVAFIFLVPPFIFKINSFFMNTFGLTMLYLGFGVIISVMMSSQNIDLVLDRFFTKPVVNIVSKVGFYSYSIYLWHMIVLKYFMIMVEKVSPVKIDNLVLFFIYFFGSIFIAIGFSKLIESEFLKFRDRHYPSRAKSSL